MEGEGEMGRRKEKGKVEGGRGNGKAKGKGKSGRGRVYGNAKGKGKSGRGKGNKEKGREEGCCIINSRN